MVISEFIYFCSKGVNFRMNMKNPRTEIQCEIVYVQVMMQLIEG